MPFPLLIPLLIGGASAVATAYGAKKTYDGVHDIRHAMKIGERAERLHRCACRDLEAQRGSVNAAAEAYARRKLAVREGTFRRFVDALEAIRRRGGVDPTPYLVGVDVRPDDVRGFALQSVEAVRIAGGLAQGIGSGAGTMLAAYVLVGAVGAASTGTAIGGLSGAAATSATVAWFGGGSLAAGGLGMAGGTVVLGGVVAGPALLIGGFVLASQGEKALLEAERYRARIERAVAELGEIGVFFGAVERRTGELAGLVASLDQRADRALRALEAVVPAFDVRDETHVRRFQEAASLCKALSDVMAVPVLDEAGSVSAASQRVLARYAAFGAN